MCGRYALALRPSQVRQQFESSNMPVQDAPADDQVRQSYNFAPDYHGLVYRAEAPDPGDDDARYKLQSMQWGLVPFWTKRNPDYASKLKTINCRDDSLIQDGGMWTTMKKKKRCIVVAQGFYEWLKKNNAKDKMPHFTRRKDGQLMCFAGLWDCVTFQDSTDKLYTYSIITTDSNKQLSFLHDRMPVILENGSEAIRTWLDPNRTEWSSDLQSLLTPYQGILECYPVTKDVGKVGNNSPSFLIPIDSAQNKNNIANFFDNQKKAAKTKSSERAIVETENDVEDATGSRATTDRVEGTEDNAPLPVPADTGSAVTKHLHGFKRELSEDDEPRLKKPKPAPTKTPDKKQGTRSATSNGSAAKITESGNSKITGFFTKK